MSVMVNHELTDELMEFVVNNLTQPQRRFLVTAITTAPEGTQQVEVSGDGRVVNALMRRQMQLIHESYGRLYLTRLGLAAAVHLNRTGNWELPRPVRVHTTTEIDL